jgi:hypothetical protein
MTHLSLCVCVCVCLYGAEIEVCAAVRLVCSPSSVEVAHKVTAQLINASQQITARYLNVQCADVCLHFPTARTEWYNF